MCLVLVVYYDIVKVMAADVPTTNHNCKNNSKYKYLSILASVIFYLFVKRLQNYL